MMDSQENILVSENAASPVEEKETQVEVTAEETVPAAAKPEAEVQPEATAQPEAEAQPETSAEPEQLLPKNARPTPPRLRYWSA